jgi:hypothetical protein
VSIGGFHQGLNDLCKTLRAFKPPIQHDDVEVFDARSYFLVHRSSLTIQCDHPLSVRDLVSDQGRLIYELGNQPIQTLAHVGDLAALRARGDVTEADVNALRPGGMNSRGVLD